MAEGRIKGEVHNASIDKLEDYIEYMYSDNAEDQIRVSKQILYLLHEAENLEVIVSHETLLGILARTLRDEYRKNIDLSIYLSAIFCVFSNYADIHPALLQGQIGDTSMKIIDYHIQKHELLASRSDQKLAMLDRKQTRLLYLCTTTLMNLAEDIKIERKMKRRGIIKSLVKLLYRDNLKLLEVTFNFLKKLSVFAENKNEMIEEGIVAALQRFVPCPHHIELCTSVIRLIHNLLFDPEFRLLLDSNGFIPRLVSLLKQGPYRGITIRILYQLSLEDKCKSTFTYTEAIPIIYMLVIQFPEPRVGKELIGLAINLCTNPRNAEIMADGGQLKTLVQRGLENRDDLLMKMLRNISKSAKTQHVQNTFAKFSKKFIEIVVKNEEVEMVVEILGILVNLEIEGIWSKLLENSGLLDFLQQNLVIGYAEDDIVLESIMLVGTILNSPNVAKMVADTLIIKLLNNLISEKQEDDEMVMQIMYAFSKMLYFKHTRNVILNQTRAVDYILELLQDKNPRIRQLADSTLALVQEFDEEWKEEIKAKRFELFNQEWIAFVQQSEMGEDWEENSEGVSDHMQWADLSELGNNMWTDDSDA